MVQLQINQTYNSGNRAFRILERLGSGEKVLVYQAQVIQVDKPSYLCALKIARTSDARAADPLEQEARLLNQFISSGWWENIPHPPFPTQVETLTLIDERGRQIPALSMELVEAPELFEVCQNKLKEAVNSKPKLIEAEVFAWQVARYYVSFLEVLLLKFRVATGDRKRDTFRYDARFEAPYGLIVMDWNAVNENVHPTTDVGANALRNFAQNWYRMLTRKAPGNVPSIFVDANWGPISLMGRHFLHRILVSSTYIRAFPGVDEQFQRIKEDLDAMIRLMTDRETLARAFDENRQVNNEALNDDRARELLAIFDLTERCIPALAEQARAAYDQLYEAHFTVLKGQSLEERLRRLQSMSEEAERSAIAASINEMLLEIRRFVIDERGQIDRFNLGRNFRQVIDAIDQVHVPLESGVTPLKSHIESLQERLRAVFAQDVLELRMPELARTLRVYLALVEYNDLVSQASSQNEIQPFVAELEDKLKNLLAWAEDSAYVGIFARLGLSRQSIADTLEILETDKFAQLITEQVAQSREIFIDYCRQNDFGGLRRLFLAMQQTPSISTGQIAVLDSYLDLADRLQVLMYSSYVTDDQRMVALLELRDIVEAYPELRDWVVQSPFFDAMQTMYESWVKQAEQESAPPIALKRAIDLARTLRGFYAGAAEEKHG